MTMSRLVDCVAVALAVIVFAGGCSSESLHPTGDMPPRTGTGGGGALGLGGMAESGTGGLRGTGGGDTGSPPDAEFCCPPDSFPTSCMHLGGQSYKGMCDEVCDFWGSSNWRVETDAHGCPAWRYDYGGGPCASQYPGVPARFCIDAGASHSDDAGDRGN
jgi:hypothetical protein